MLFLRAYRDTIFSLAGIDKELKANMEKAGKKQSKARKKGNDKDMQVASVRTLPSQLLFIFGDNFLPDLLPQFLPDLSRVRLRLPLLCTF